MADAEEYLVVFITTSNHIEGEKISQLLVSNRVAACVNIVPGVRSKFWWQGKVDATNESLLVVKTKAHLMDRLCELVRENSCYEVPEVIALPIVAASQDYLDWMDGELGAGA
ncbi:MAG: divalent-cation tolerance protein CutA [Chloroflexota bacterium]|nr:divalent-cation tolerance protein CutA [Chloroflexota bacterium]